jgi:alpha-methylacyl-CoA racemase
VKIVSIAQNVPGPVAVSRLVADGASAVKVEPPGGDLLEIICKPWYDELHAGIRVVRLDLKRPDGMDALRMMLVKADVFIASHRPSALARLGLDADGLARDFPALCHLNIVGDTANPDDPGHDLTYLARAGLLRDGMPATLLADMIGADRAHAAVRHFMSEPPGARRVVGLFDAVHDVAAPLRHGLTKPGGPLAGGNPCYGIYAARDGRVAIAALEPHFRARVYEVLGLSDGSDLSMAFLTRTAAEWERWGVEHDLPIVEILT